MSPGGSTPNSRRSRPELPPSSVTVTTAVTVSVPIGRLPARARRGPRGRPGDPCRRRSPRCAERVVACLRPVYSEAAGESGRGVRSGSVERGNRIHGASRAQLRCQQGIAGLFGQSVRLTLTNRRKSPRGPQKSAARREKSRPIDGQRSYACVTSAHFGAPNLDNSLERAL